MTMSETSANPENRIALFWRKEVRRAIPDNEWWFVVEDAVLALIDSRGPKQYIQRMKQRDPELGKGWAQIERTPPVPATGGGDEKLATPVLLLHEEDRLRIPRDDVEAREPKIICFPGIPKE
jgi:hypothetical protein